MLASGGYEELAPTGTGRGPAQIFLGALVVIGLMLGLLYIAGGNSPIVGIVVAFLGAAGLGYLWLWPANTRLLTGRGFDGRLAFGEAGLVWPEVAGPQAESMTRLAKSRRLDLLAIQPLTTRTAADPKFRPMVFSQTDLPRNDITADNYPSLCRRKYGSCVKPSKPEEPLSEGEKATFQLTPIA